ncbi:hypothetical protein COCVIDRAFT_116483 [Bipolaris victoriae FI3]|uniref:Uncharacterized protein n=1 Tax=Bipolaris victoriae (strain FI3) TaxID=930091 RepID=W7E3J0_BIPV3|nr:hypothetical protein COCVIDRAFT_116483 [Bipolaris victoriae FI3]
MNGWETTKDPTRYDHRGARGHVISYPAKTGHPTKYRIAINLRIACYPRYPANR